LALPDLHFPVEDRRSLAAVEKYAAEYEWDKVVYLGDVMDFNCVSSHNINNLRAVEGQTLQADYDYANGVLDRHQEIFGDAQLVMLEGNHDYRVERYIDANPRLRGSIEVAKGLRLAERGIKWVRNWSNGTVYRIGKALFTHGIYTNEHHAKKHVQRYGENTFYGHVHDVQSFSQVLYGDNSTIVGQSLGCLCDYAQAYMQGKPNNWQQAFGVFHFMEDGLFNYFVPRLFKHRFVSPEGKVYQG
jgi:hypothetical protein